MKPKTKTTRGRVVALLALGAVLVSSLPAAMAVSAKPETKTELASLDEFVGGLLPKVTYCHVFVQEGDGSAAPADSAALFEAENANNHTQNYPCQGSNHACAAACGGIQWFFGAVFASCVVCCDSRTSNPYCECVGERGRAMAVCTCIPR